MRKFFINLYFYAVAVLLVIYSLFVFYYQIIRSTDTVQITNKKTAKIPITSMRGSIITEDNKVLAFDVIKYNIILDPALIDDEYLQTLLDILEKNATIDRKKLEQEIIDKRIKGKRYLKIKDQIVFDQKEQIEKEVSTNIYKQQSRKKQAPKRFLAFEKNEKRVYANNTEFANIVGYLDNEKNGVYGIEKYYNDHLRGIDGLMTEYRAHTVEAKAKSVPTILSRKIVKEPKQGYDVILSINSVMQYTLQEAMKEVYDEYSPKTVSAVLMDVNTGQIIAMDSYPKPEDIGLVKNHVISDLFEPGSIFKPITIAIAIEDGKINKNTIIHSDGYIRVKNRLIHDHDRSTLGSLPVIKIITHSGNVAMVKIADMVSTPDYYDYLDKFGFWNKTGIDTYYEITNKKFPLKELTEVRKSNVSFGQGISMTQLQMLVALNATINGGYLVKPKLMKAVVDKDGNIIEEVKIEKKQILSENTSKQIRQMLENVVSSGTGRRMQIKGYSFGGKTGTAQKAGPRGYEKGKYFSSFYTFFPVDNPKYAILVTANEPQGKYYGASVALPAARKIASQFIEYMDISPDKLSELENIPLEKKPRKAKTSVNEAINLLNQNIMPDLIGYNKKDILELSKGSKYKIQVNGSGFVINQNFLKDYNLSENDIIILNLE